MGNNNPLTNYIVKMLGSLEAEVESLKEERDGKYYVRYLLGSTCD